MGILRKNIDENPAAKASLKEKLGITNLEENQYTGVVVYSTLAELPATGTLLVSYKVSNDTDSSKNGYYHWSGSAYVKDAGLANGSVAKNDDEAISGNTAYNERLLGIVQDEVSRANERYLLYKHQGNLYQKDGTRENTIFDGSGNLISHASYAVSDLIRIEEGESYSRTTSDQVALYDKDGNFIRQTTAQPFTVNAGEIFARCSFSGAYIETYSFFKSGLSAEPSFELRDEKINLEYVNTNIDYDARFKTIQNTGDRVEETGKTANQSMNLKEVQREVDLSKTKDFGSLFDPEKMIPNKVLNSSGVLLTHASYGVSELIQIEEGVTYYQEPYKRIIAVYATDGSFVRYFAENATNSFTAQAGELYIRISMPYTARYDYAMYEGASNVKFAHKERDLNYKNIVRDDFTVDLSQLREIERFGGEVVAGTVGEKQAILKFPVSLGKGGTIDFDFVCDFDPHKTQSGSQLLFMLDEPGLNYDSKFSLNPTTPNKGNFFPVFTSVWESAGLSTAGNNRSLSLWKNNFCGEDCFSIQKVSNVVAGDDGLSIRVTDTAVEVYNGVTTIASYDFATYTTVDEIITAMQVDAALSDFEIIAYESANRNSSDLARVDMAMVVNREDWDADNNIGLGTFSNDSWPVYLPASGKGIKHRCRMVFEGDVNAGTGKVRLWVDGFPVRELTGNRAYHNGFLYLGGKTGFNTFDGWISNLRIRRTIVDEPIYTVIIAHLTSNDLDGVPQVGQRASIGRMERGLRAMKDRGYEFVTHKQFMDYVLGNAEPPQKVAYIIYDDTQFGHWTNERIRQLYQKYGFKAATSIIMKNLDGVPGSYSEADVLKYIEMSKQIGWDWVSHTYNHWNQDSLHYDQTKADVDAVKSVMEAKQLYTDALVQPQGSGPNHTRKYWLHNIYQMAFKYADGAGFYGGDPMGINRIYWDNSWDFDGFIDNIEGKFPLTT